MKILLKSVILVDSSHPQNGKKLDILIKNGKIAELGKDLKADSSTKIVEREGLHISKGWIDMLANFQDPGYEQKEDIKSGLRAAAAGGFTRVGISPLTFPIRDSKSQIDYLLESAEKSAVEPLPYASLSKGAKGEELAEFYDLSNAGAIAFYDDRNPVRNPNLLKNALLYSKSMDALVVNFPYQADISPSGVMNEGESSTNLGLKGIPQLAEELMVQRDLYLQEYTGGRLHFSTLSSAKSIDMLDQAKQAGTAVSCDLASYTILLDDSELDSYDSRFKTLPPLRSKKEIKEIIKRIKKGKVDALCSNHTPEDIDAKMKEFDLAEYGIINLQTAVPAAITALEKEIDLDKIIELFTDGPAKILKLKQDQIKEGENANLTLFLPNEYFEFNKEDVLSKSQNSPFFKRSLKGKVFGIINRNKMELNDLKEED